MKVTRNTPNQLIVEDRPFLITLLLGFILFASSAGALDAFSYGEFGVGLMLLFTTAFVGLCIFLFVRRVQLIFDRKKNTLTFRSRNLARYQEIVHKLDELSHAVTRGGDTQRSVLIFNKGMSKGEHPVTKYSTSGPAPKRITDAINAWLKDSAAVDSKGSNT